MPENFMNEPVDSNGIAYVQYDYKTGKAYIHCPHCGKKQFPVEDASRRNVGKSMRCGFGLRRNQIRMVLLSERA